MLMLILLFGCSHKASGPSWVSGIRSGEERLQVRNGDKLLFRRISSTCNRAIHEAERDIEQAGYNVPVYREVVFQAENDCAVTLSIKPSEKAQEAPEDKMGHLSRMAAKHAVTGLRAAEFEAAVKDRVVLDIDFQNQCWQNFHKSGASYHGSTTVCWKFGAIVGYCLEESCYTR